MNFVNDILVDVHSSTGGHCSGIAQLPKIWSKLNLSYRSTLMTNVMWETIFYGVYFIFQVIRQYIFYRILSPKKIYI